MKNKHDTLETPILFLIFNRPETTQKVFNEIKRAKPSRLYIAADGPRKNHPEDELLCQRTRDILRQIDWNCEVKTFFRKENAGVGKAPSEGITWFFDNVEKGIILEDDCLPNQSFFRFCEELLEYYKDDERIMHISGNNFLFGAKIGKGSYYFSKFTFSWGWATWRRAWRFYDFDMKSYPGFIEKKQISNVLSNKEIQRYWLRIFRKMYEKEIVTWDYQWTYAVWAQNGLAVLPNENLVSNIGFGNFATNTTDPEAKASNMKTSEIERIVHPSLIMADHLADVKAYRTLYKRTKMSRLKSRVKRIFK